MAKENENAGGLVAMPRELVELLFEKLGAPQAAVSGFDPAQLAEILKATGLSTAQAMQQALKPENQFHPGVSCYSYPEGDRDRPRPKLKCKMTWVGVPVFEDTQHWYELELLNTLEPGEYRVTNADQSMTLLTVRPEADSVTGKIDKLHITFPVRDGQKNNVSPMSVWLLEAQGKSYMDAMTTWLTVMAKDLAAKSGQMVAA